ncbi:hypothetical protein [Candidatus Palauibacter sp.]|uniref:hypothetical protein n=1 Tax=Candidatus Palauibacter sp. TaxID=3101350 RepID=UPI003B022BC5
MVLDEGGEMRIPTPESALQQLIEPRHPEAFRIEPAVAVLTQLFESRPRAELAAFAESLVHLAADTGHPRRVQFDASSALMEAVLAREGVPYEPAFDLLVGLYETYMAGLAGDERDDPIAAIHARNRAADFDESMPRAVHAVSALHAVYLADPEGRGLDYLLGAMEAAGPPASREAGRHSTWCAANDFFYRDATFDGASTDAALRTLPVDAATYHDLCGLVGSIPRSYPPRRPGP